LFRALTPETRTAWPQGGARWNYTSRSAGVRTWCRNGPRGGAEVGSSSTGGAPGFGQRDASGSKKPRRERTRLAPAIPFIDAILEADRHAPRKQRHTAHRIWTRLRQQKPEIVVGESTVREYVNLRKQALGLLCHEVFVPQSYQFGGEAAGGLVRDPGSVRWSAAQDLHLLHALDGFGRRPFIERIHMHATGFSGSARVSFRVVWRGLRTLRFDNLSSAVKKILRGHQREETTRFIAFRSHWGFTAEFCTPGEGHEKGGVEGEGGQFRRNHLVPVPKVHDLEGLNRLLSAVCLRNRTGSSPGAACRSVHRCGRARASAAVGCRRLRSGRVAFSPGQPERLRKVLTNFYSTPLPVVRLWKLRSTRLRRDLARRTVPCTA